MNPASSFPLPGISPADLTGLLGCPDIPWVLDLRRDPAFDASGQRLPLARRVAPQDLPRFIADHAPRPAIVYCVHGHEVSQNAAQQLRAAGWDARYLEGGIEACELRLRQRPDWGVTGQTPSSWITRERPKIDRVACPWLIRRFIDRDAQFLYVPTERVLAEATRLGAVAFDMPGAPVSHEGECCSFDTLLAAFDLQQPALDLLARIVRGADTDRLELAAPAAGLLAVSLGMSRRHADDDHAMLAAMMPVYDALYAWCSDQIAGQRETHNWTPQ